MNNSTSPSSSSQIITNWTTKFTRGKGCRSLVDYVLLSEFDIDTGSTLRHQYPSPIPNYKADWFAEHMLPEGAHNRESDFTYFFLNRDEENIDNYFWIKPPPNYQEIDIVIPQDKNLFLYGLNFVKTKYDSSVRRGAIVKAICIFSPYHFIESFKKPLELALEDYFNNSSVDVLKNLYDSLNAIDISCLPRPDYVETLLMRRGIVYDPIREISLDHVPKSWVRSLQYEDLLNPSRSIPISIPLYRTPDEVGDISVTNLVKIFGESVMRIYHAILTKQRVLFVGYNHSASDIAQIVLSAVALLAPPVNNIIKRTFPYATLSDLGFLETKGYIAGVTNPMFQQRESWWDLLCILDLPNNIGHVYSAEDKKPDIDSRGGISSSTSSSNPSKLNISSAEEAQHFQADNKFILAVTSGINARIGEDWVRRQFHDYTMNIINYIQDKNALMIQNPLIPASLNPSSFASNLSSQAGSNINTNKVDDRMKKFLDSNSLRMTLLEMTTEYQSMPSHLWVWAANKENQSHTNWTKRLTESYDLQESEQYQNDLASNDFINEDYLLMKSFLRKLQYETKAMSKGDVELIYQYLEKGLRSEASLQCLLVILPESQGGLLPLAMGLFHTSVVVKYYTMVILTRIKEFPSTNSAHYQLNPFILNSYERLFPTFEDGSLKQEAEVKHRQSLTLGKRGTSGATELSNDNETEDNNEHLDEFMLGSKNPLDPSNIGEFLSQSLSLINPETSSTTEEPSSEIGNINPIDFIA